jgi:hypothetical protein
MKVHAIHIAPGVIRSGCAISHGTREHNWFNKGCSLGIAQLHSS